MNKKSYSNSFTSTKNPMVQELKSHSFSSSGKKKERKCNSGKLGLEGVGVLGSVARGKDRSAFSSCTPVLTLK